MELRIKYDRGMKIVLQKTWFQFGQKYMIFHFFFPVHAYLDHVIVMVANTLWQAASHSFDIH